ncbi:hypothetical protein [Nitrospirillum amazonense]|uniref:Uncharacterized protein n=1 Tax=Nitrospirillum amazonense TaxID=28077 RepID=A0A560K368_9PROT|nr:hypothetical protein [Nitrospirillum amazonense]MDG3440626.1 hypothetical protein [Nitrospirillum amazonense]TWB75040.1 hypothetical protein FBZ87_104136 [Nitrospirillum amazonense]
MIYYILFLVILALVTLVLARRGVLEGRVLAAGLLVLPGVTAMEDWFAHDLGALGLSGGHVGPVTLLLILGACVEEAGRYLLLSLSNRDTRAAVSAGYAWAAWELGVAVWALARGMLPLCAAGNVHCLSLGFPPLLALGTVLVARSVPSLLHVALSFGQLWAVRATYPAARTLWFVLTVVVHLAINLAIVRHGHL